MHSKSHLHNLGPQEKLSEESQCVAATNTYSSQLKSRGGWITFAHPSSRNFNQTHSSENHLLGPPESRFQGCGMHLYPDTPPWNPGMQQGRSERGSLAAASPRDHPAQVQCRKSTWISWKNLTFSSHTNYGKKLLKVRFHYTHPRASSCVRWIFLKNTLGSQCPTWHLCFCSLFAIFHSLLTSPSVVVLAALRNAGTPWGPQGHGALGWAGQVTHLGAGRGRTLAELPIHWSGNWEKEKKKKGKKKTKAVTLSCWP